MTVLLETRSLSLSFGGLKAVAGFSFALPAGEIHGLIGPNGAGKTTVFNLLTGVYRPDAGEILLNGRSLVGLKPFQIAQAGVGRTFQNIRLFSQLSVLDNVRVACHLRARHGLTGAVLRLRSHVVEEAAITEQARRLLELVRLDGRAEEPAASLPYGEQRRLEIARALAIEPRLLLLDEPAAGANPNEKQALAQLIRRIHEQFRLTTLIIEHDMNVIMNLCERITVLDYGVVIACGTPEQVQRDPKVIEAYLGATDGIEAA